MALSTFSLPRGFLGVLPQDSHFTPAVELQLHKLQARPLKVSMHPLLCSALRYAWLVFDVCLPFRFLLE